MGDAIAVLAVTVLVVAAVLWSRASSRRARIVRRLEEARAEEARPPGAVLPGRENGRLLGGVVALAVGLAAFFLLWGSVGVQPVLAFALAAVVGIVAHVFADVFALRGLVRTEEQLADAVDLLAASLQSGLSALAALEVAATQSRAPLRPAMESLTARLRLGDDPNEVFQDFRRAVPLQSARLLAFTLAVHWEVGGSIAPALRNVARVVRDRIDVTRRVRSQAAEAQLSVVGILGITYAVAGLMWASNPEGARAFFESGVGARVAAMVVVLQAVGLLWMRRLTRSSA